MSTKTDTIPPPPTTPPTAEDYRRALEITDLSPEHRKNFETILENMGNAAVSGVAAEQARDKEAISSDARTLEEALGAPSEASDKDDAPLPDRPTDAIDDKPLTMAILGRDDDAERAARAKATKRLEHELNEGGFAKRLVNRVWKGNIRKEAYRQRYIREAKSEIQKQQDVLWYAEYNDELRNQAADSILERFRRGRHYTDAHVGETYKELGEESVVGAAMRELINVASKKATAAEWTDDKVQEKYDEIIAADQARGENSEIKGGQQVTTTDLLKVIESLRGRDMHDEALDHAVSTMRIVAGETRSGARTEANYSLSDKIIKTLGEKKWLGGLVNEATVSVALTTAFTAMNLGRGFVQRAVGLGTPGVMGAAFGAARAHKQAKDDIAMTRAEHELGEIFGANDKYRDKLDKMVYPSKSAAELTAELIASVDNKTLDEGGETALEVALKMLAEAEVRRKFTNAEYKDVDKPIALISYTSAAAQESEKLALREAELLARNKLAGKVSRLDDAASERLGVSIDMAEATRPDGTKTQIPQLNLQQRYEMPIKQQYEAQIAESDAVAKRYVLGKTAVGAAIGGAVSFGTSFALQEAAHAIADSHASPKLNLNVNNGNSGNLVPQGNAANHLSVNGNNTITENTADHTFAVKDSDGHSLVEGLKQNPNGTFDQASLDKLNGAGIHVETVHHDAVYETKTTSVDQFVTDHKSEFQQLKMSYMDNNTAAFDLNEQGGRLSYNPDGTVTIGQNMTANGSFGNGVQLDMTKTQNNVLDISFKQSDGTFLHKTFNYGQPIPKPWADMLYQKNDGTWGFKGNGEVHWGKVHDGTFYAAASIPGENKSFDLTSQVLKTPEYFENKLTVPSVESSGNGGGFTPVVVGTIGRQGLADRKALKKEEREPVLLPENEGNQLHDPTIPQEGYTGRTLESLREWIRQDPARLKTRRKEVGSDGKQVWVEADGSPVERSIQRERSVLGGYIKNEIEKYPDHAEMVKRVADTLGPMDKRTRVSVTIPSWMEERNLNHLLADWTRQVDRDGNELDPSMYEIAVLVNRKAGSEPDSSVAVINKFIEDFERTRGFKPNVRFADVEFEDGYDNVGYARRVLADAVVLRSVERPEQEGPLYFESEDADVLAVDKKSVYNLISKLDGNPHLDAVRGVQDRSPEYMKENDMLFLRRRAWDFFEIMARSKQFRNPTSPSWNFSFNRVVTGGWNTGYSAEAYATIGGYEVVPAGEDMSIGERITMVRGDGNIPNLDVIGTVSSRSDSSPRRFINEIIEKKGAYEDFSNEADNKKIREQSLTELMGSIKEFERISPQNEKEFEKFITSTFDWAQSATPSVNDAKQFERRLLFWLGFKRDDYEVTDQGVVIKSWDNVKQSLENYRSRTSGRK